ncbi:MAG: hypothetical protein AAF266_09290 [Planctomycetota bacterium]
MPTATLSAQPLFNVVLLAVSLLSVPATAEVFINEVFFDPGGAGFDQRDEFIELRGPAGFALDDYYLIAIEGEDNSAGTGAAGQIDNIFNFEGVSLGSNGFLAIRQAGNLEGGATDSGPSRYTVVPGATDLLNTGSGPGYGSGATSTIGAEDEGNEGAIENGGTTLMLIRNVSGEAPTVGFDLDDGNDGLDHPDGQEGWEIVDAVSFFEPLETVFGRAYAPVVFGREEPGQLVFFEGGIRTIDPAIEPGAEYFGVGYEIEYIGRWGNSTGQTPDDWHASNLTDNSGSGALSPAQLPPGSPVDFRQSFTGDHGDLASGSTDTPSSQPSPGQGRIESNQGVPYGTRLLTNIGGPNYITGDYNGDGVVNAADYTTWRDTEGTVGTEFAHPAADHNHDFDVDAQDYAIWTTNFGAPNATVLPASSTVPEPASVVLVALAITARLSRRP